MFKNKTLLITGGTGSFGNAVLNRFLDTDIKEIRIFSRDEKKQDDMCTRLKNDKLKFYIGDVRDYNSIGKAMDTVNVRKDKTERKKRQRTEKRRNRTEGTCVCA